MVDMKTILAESPTARLLQGIHNRNIDEVKEAILAGAKIVDSNFNALEYALQKAVFHKSGTRLGKKLIWEGNFLQVVPFHTLCRRRKTTEIKGKSVCSQD